MMAQDMMQRLAQWLDAARGLGPTERLVVVLDVDGTILDPRAAIHYTLQSYDREHNTRHFWGLDAARTCSSCEALGGWLAAWPMPQDARPAVERWVRGQLWTPEVLLAASRPYPGVMDVLRWMQLQPRLQIALSTSRPECLRAETLRALHALGAPWRVRFPSDLLMMSPFEATPDVIVQTKQGALDALRARGLRPVVVLDSDPATLAAMRGADPRAGEVLWLDSAQVLGPDGDGWDIAALTSPEALMASAQIAWHGVHDEALLARFIASPVQWAEADVRFDAMYRLVLGERGLPLEAALETLRATDKGLKLDLATGGVLIERVITLLQRMEWPHERLWLHGNLDALGEADFVRLSRWAPGALLQTQVDFLGPMLPALPRHAHAIVEELGRWGIRRFSVGWTSPDQRAIVEALQSWDVQTNLWAIPDRRALLQAALLTPDSLTASLHAI